jgi:WD40 repeat protein
MEFPAHNALPINRCQFIYEDSVIITCSDDKTIGLWDSASGDCRHLLAGHQHSVKDMDLVERIHNGTSEQRTLLDHMFCPLYRGCPLFGGSKCIRTMIIWDIENCPLLRGVPISEVHLYVSRLTFL